MRTILQDNALAALLTVGWPARLPAEDLGSVTSRVLALHGNPRMRRANESLPGAVPHAEVSVDAITERLPCYPMSMPEDCCRRVLAFLASGAPRVTLPST